MNKPFKTASKSEFKHFANEKWEIQSLAAVPAFIGCAPYCGIIGMKKALGYSYTKFIMGFEKDLCRLYYNVDDMQKNTTELIKRYHHDKNYLTFLWTESEKAANKFSLKIYQ